MRLVFNLAVMTRNDSDAAIGIVPDRYFEHFLGFGAAGYQFGNIEGVLVKNGNQWAAPQEVTHRYLGTGHDDVLTSGYFVDQQIRLIDEKNISSLWDVRCSPCAICVYYSIPQSVDHTNYPVPRQRSDRDFGAQLQAVARRGRAGAKRRV